MNNTKKRVLIYSIAYYPLIGGAEIAIKEITDRIPEIEWHMVTRLFEKKDLRYEVIGNVCVHRVNCPKIFFPFVGFWKGRKLHKEKTFDIVWSMMTYAGFPGLFLKLNFSKIKFLLSLQEGTPFYDIKKKALVVYPLFKLMFKKADMIQVISNFLARIANDMGTDKEVVVIPNGVDLSLFSKEPPMDKVLSLVKKLGKKDGDVYLVTTSRLSYKNGVDDVIRALEYLPNNIKFLIAGIGEDDFKLRILAEKNGVRDRVLFLGLVDQKDLPVLLRVSDIFIRVSRSEGFGNSFIEAMASGLPVIATPVGGITDFIDDRETGFFACPDNPKNVAEAIMELVNHHGLLEHIAIQGQNRVRMRYGWDIIVSEMKDKVFGKLFV
ncbi:MAG: glycosyltransferase family 4 protein [Minisyncoccota bacterium]